MSTNSNIKTGFSKELKQLRGRLKKNQFAEILGVEYPTYLRYESGEIEPKPPIMKLARILSKSAVVNYKEAQSKEWYTKEDMAAPYYINQLLDDARKILTSGNQAAIGALERNIRYFSHTIDLENRMVEMEDRIKAIEVKKDISVAATVKKET